MDQPDIVNNFYGVYLLYCENPQYKGRIYIGYTVDPVKRLCKHNAGKKFGGAWKTSNRGPWNMVLIVHGFPNSTSALRFEWAWQHADLSRRLRHVPKKKSNEILFNYKLRVLSAMLQVGPWCRLPLTLRWLDQTFANIYSYEISPPLHMPICYGPVQVRKTFHKKMTSNETAEDSDNIDNDNFRICDICYKRLSECEQVVCLNSNCNFIAHIVCLADHFVKNEDSILPVEGTCPKCNVQLLWGEIVKRKNAGNQFHSVSSSDSD